jgi:hypothetical protein
MNLLIKFKPAVSRRTLLLVAGCAWSIAGGILITRAMIQLIIINHFLIIDMVAGVIIGIGFYLLLFAKISKRHITRITLIKVDNPCFFSFFNFRSYIMMAIMITGGITLRRLDVINHEILYTFFLMMGLPLLISAYRFFFSYVKNKSME